MDPSRDLMWLWVSDFTGPEIGRKQIIVLLGNLHSANWSTGDIIRGHRSCTHMTELTSSDSSGHEGQYIRGLGHHRIHASQKLSHEIYSPSS
ncbi:hypothetical protein GX50_06371 [[Emmonsia] crescens]|uniref:Uncharacterized protein n=1 Tax=[Emmonsia] crescens TaxID=73230 RepID=A0A2B7ZBX9_9EURO|nr:hypothetical protein GX50_06371 [Emmonsia crescens]